MLFKSIWGPSVPLNINPIYSGCVVPPGGEKSHLCVHVACTVPPARRCPHYCLLVSECAMQPGRAALHISEPARCTSVVTLVTAEKKQTREKEVDQLDPLLRKRSGVHLPSDASRRAEFLACVFCSIKPPLCFLSSSSFLVFVLMDSGAGQFSIHNQRMLWVFRNSTNVDARRHSRKRYFDLPRFLFPFNLFSFTTRWHKAAVMNRENVTPKVRAALWGPTLRKDLCGAHCGGLFRKARRRRASSQRWWESESLSQPFLVRLSSLGMNRRPSGNGRLLSGTSRSLGVEMGFSKRGSLFQDGVKGNLGEMLL